MYNENNFFRFLCGLYGNNNLREERDDNYEIQFLSYYLEIKKYEIGALAIIV